jgi:hypothetical protein
LGHVFFRKALPDLQCTLQMRQEQRGDRPVRFVVGSRAALGAARASSRLRERRSVRRGITVPARPGRGAAAQPLPVVRCVSG